jgi:hypothetical protein
MEVVKKETERRRKQRFEIHREAHYKITEDGLVVANGCAETVNICSEGVAFQAEGRLKRGAFVELSISWPALLNGNCAMRLIVFGRILRVNGQRAACTLEKYEFRTQSRKLQTMPELRTSGMLRRWVDEMRKAGLKTDLAAQA